MPDLFCYAQTRQNTTQLNSTTLKYETVPPT